MTNDASATGIERYRPLGLIDNPFRLADEPAEYGMESATAEASHRLLSAVMTSAAESNPKPIVVRKNPEFPSQYPMRAISTVEHSFATDTEVGVLHAYVQLYTLRSGRVRSTLAAVAERLAFRSFDKTLAAYIGKVLAEPDDTLISYQMVGAEGLAAFKETFDANPQEAVSSVFGEPQVERHPELEMVGDLRVNTLEPNVDESAEVPELDSTLGDGPGMGAVMDEQAEEMAAEDQSGAIRDYLVEYTKLHLSPVIARALRVYKERGFAAMAMEFRITKAPRKTLAALIRLAHTRFRKVVIIYDGFDNWNAIAPDLRAQIASDLSELRWLLDGDALLIMMLEVDLVPELEETFGSATPVEWDFADITELFSDRDKLDPEMIGRWLSGAALAGCTPLSMADPVLDRLAAAADGKLSRFILSAYTAIENAADRGVAALDEEAEAAGLSATLPEVM